MSSPRDGLSTPAGLWNSVGLLLRTEFVYPGCCSILIMVQQVRNLTLGLTLSTPGLVLFIFQSIVTIKGQMYFDGKIRI